MAIAVFGQKTFAVSAERLYTLYDLQYGSSLDTEKQDAAGKKPSTYNKGPGLNSLSLKVSFDAAFGVNPRREIEEWEAIKDAGVAHQFILGSRPLGRNKWLLVEVQAGGYIIDNSGAVLAAELSLRFDEYVRPGSAQASADSTGLYAPGFSVSGLSPAVAVDPNSVLTPEEKKFAKRDNPKLRAGVIGWNL